MARYRILVSDTLGQAGLDRLEAAEDADWRMEPGLAPEALRAAVAEIDGLIVRSGTTADAALVAAAPRLRVIGRAGTGVDNIDLAAAAEAGVTVVNTPTANSQATAEHTLAMMLAVSRHIAPAHASLKAGEWRRADFVGQELGGKALGVVGFGRIGRLVAERARAFGMRILAHDPYVDDAAGRAAGADEMLGLDELFARADYITLHTAVTPETRGLVGAERLARVKEGAILVNCARGPLVDEAALAEALDRGPLARAALDVYEEEPPDGSPLIGRPDVLHVPHLGASTVEAQRAVATLVVDDVLRVLRGEAPDSPVRPKG